MPDSLPAARDILQRPKPDAGAPGIATASRLIAVVVGIDAYGRADGPDSQKGLACAANDAESVASTIRQAHPGDALDMSLLTSPSRPGSLEAPTRAAILRAVQRAATLSGPEDTVIFYFAGHGGLVDGRPAVFPSDVRLTSDGQCVSAETVLEVGELQALFDGAACIRRVMLLDCCQTACVSGALPAVEPASPPVAGCRALAWRTGLPVSTDLVQALRTLPHGWSVLLACGPNEYSLEDPEVGEHGIFSHFLAEGLGGQADLDGDGVVSLAELAQYLGRRVGRQSQAVIEEERERSARGTETRGPLPVGQERQTPTMFWAGPMDFPLTRGSSVARRGFQPGVAAATRRYVLGELPYRLSLLPQLRWGVAILWGLGVGLSLLSFPAFPPSAGWIAWAVICGAVCGGLWFVMIALAAAANEAAWHAGGYATAWAAAVLHLAIFVATLGLGIVDAGWPTAADAAFPLAAALMVLLSLVIVFGCNEVQSIIVLADLVQRDDRVVLRRVFRHLDRHRLQARLNNRLAMVSAHPLVYQVLGLVLSVTILAHAVYLWFSGLTGGGLYLLLARDFVLIVLILWQTQWYPAAYHSLYRAVLPDK